MSKPACASCWGSVIAGLTLTLCAAPLAAQTGTIGLNFTGVTLADGQSLNAGNGYAPPDSDGAVGPNNVAQLINGAFAVYDKSTGNQQELISGRQFWINAGLADPGTSLNGLGAFNPRIVYDPTVGRWFAAELTGQSTNNNVMVARSNTADPLGGWKAVSFLGNAGGSGKFVDFTRMGIDANGVYVSTDNFTMNSQSASFTGVSVFSLPKADLLAAAPSTANLTRFDDLSRFVVGQSLQPIINFGPAHANAPILATTAQNPSTVLFRTDLSGTSGGGAALSDPTTIDAPLYSNAPPAAQPDGTRSISTIDRRFTGNVYQVGHTIYAAHATTLGANAAIEWIKLDEPTSAIIQEGILSDPHFDYFQPSIAANAKGDVVISFTRSGLEAGGNLSDFAVVGHSAGDVTTFGDPLLLKASGVDNYHYVNGRWGDYTTTVVDPNDPNVFWAFQEYAAGSNAWATQITEITVPEPATLVLAVLALGGLSLAAWRRRQARATS